MLEKIMKSAQSIEDKLITIRRDMHRQPELALQEERTANYIADKLRALGCEVTENVGKTGVVGLLKGSEAGKTLAIRADMDALPIQEETGHEFCSTRSGVMHACGHDAHIAVVLGTAEILSGMRDSFAGNIKLIFQPSEESPIGGADEMIREGVLENPTVDAAIALHVNPGLSTGQIGYKEGPFFASVAFFAIEILGKGGHGALPHHSVNPILVAAECIQALQTIASAQIDPMEPFVLSLGSIHGGQKSNIIPEKVSIEGTVRCFGDELMNRTGQMMENILRSITSAYGAGYTLKFKPEVKTLINDKIMIGLIKEAGEQILGKENTLAVSPVLLGDDFASFSQLVPSAYIYLGGGFHGQPNFALHHPKFDLDEGALPLGAALLSYTALKFLSKGP
ncbi:amidohydrolase [Desulfitobacterium dichloroeliminans LMG P-21439]|uniref:Amidohydrolase n=1 Tax=Desulfitobacterium dichloroeliminans (strain LMG P-21439 / DCA1) TaxID=871963 RepID=L0F5T5_DESDL|nr:M20 family metallopeptidase [Desulfitobacterium dichloroeliminans]AGA68410.1 amidohydrolase [Desulfitobacterium dichloroeliminans LMG P-21439]